jgi:hypothetical protein
MMETVMLMRHRIMNAPPALKAFLDARESGASRDELTKLAAAAQEENDELKARRQPPGPRLRLAVDNDRKQDTATSEG